MIKKEELSLYIHIPFCKTRCSYCDFNTYAGMESIIPAYIDAVKIEIDHFARHLRDKYSIHTVYFGGGTPSLLPAEKIDDLLEMIRSKFDVDDFIEISLEANPNGLTKEFLKKINQSGINRISIGMQSAILQELKVLDRYHDLNDVKKSITFAREAGFNNINLDIMYGIPFQTIQTLTQSINAALDLQPDHLSVYGLILHEETRLMKSIDAGIVRVVDEDVEGDMYAWLMEYLPEKGFEQYEISNWARGEKYFCKHNLAYWQNSAYLGIGAGAYSHLCNTRWNNVLDIPSYIDAVSQLKDEKFVLNTSQNMIKLEKSDKIKETMIMGLRLTREGINLNQFKHRFANDLLNIYGKEIKRLQDQGLVELVEINGEKCLRLTIKGCMLGNQVFMAFL